MGPPPYDRFQLFCTTEITISAWTKQTTYEDGSLRPSPPHREGVPLRRR
jgi:hypothetical protein